MTIAHIKNYWQLGVMIYIVTTVVLLVIALMIIFRRHHTSSCKKLFFDSITFLVGLNKRFWKDSLFDFITLMLGQIIFGWLLLVIALLPRFMFEKISSRH